ncbi:MAG: hypothetical protein KGO02_04165 [Alphaproteobacteria bacterium]|nr:hypothetical protein [Alphaproteobacteria bacterium]
MAAGIMLVGLMLSGPAMAAISARRIVTHGLMDIPACSTCHGVNEAGRAVGGVSRIGGMNEHYLVHELKSMTSGDRESAVMSAIARK